MSMNVNIFIETFEKIHKWLSKSLKNAIKKKFNLYKIYIRNKTMENELRYKNYIKRFKNILKKEKYYFHQNMITQQ